MNGAHTSVSHQSSAGPSNTSARVSYPATSSTSAPPGDTSPTRPSGTNHRASQQQRVSSVQNSPQHRRQQQHSLVTSPAAQGQQGAFSAEQQIWLAVETMHQEIKKLKDDQVAIKGDHVDIGIAYQRFLDEEENRWREQRVQNDRLMSMVRVLETETSALHARLKEARVAQKSAKEKTTDVVLNGGTAAVRSQELTEDCEDNVRTRSKLKRAKTLPSVDTTSSSTVEAAPAPTMHLPEVAPGGPIQGRGCQAVRRRSQSRPSNLSVLHEEHLADQSGEVDARTVEDKEHSLTLPELQEPESSGTLREEPPLAEVCPTREVAADEQLKPAEREECHNVDRQSPSMEELKAEEQLRPPEADASCEVMDHQQIFAGSPVAHDYEALEAEESMQEDKAGALLAPAYLQATQPFDREEGAERLEENAVEECEWQESGESENADGDSDSSSSGEDCKSCEEFGADDSATHNAGEEFARLSRDPDAIQPVGSLLDLFDNEATEEEDDSRVKAALIIQKIWRFGARKFDLSKVAGKERLQAEQPQISQGKLTSAPLGSCVGTNMRPVPRLERRKTVLARNEANLKVRHERGALKGGEGKQVSSEALLEAVREGNEELCMVLLLTANSRMVNQVDSMGRTPLHLAASLGMAKVCDALLRNRNFESADAVHVGGWTALHVAARQGRDHVVKVLLSSDRFHAVNGEDDSGRTALHAAAVNGNPDIVRDILDHPGFTAVDLQNFGGFTALHVAERHGHSAVCSLISQFNDDTTRRRISVSPGSSKHRRATKAQRRRRSSSHILDAGTGT